MYVLVNLLVDISYALLDPRVRVSMTASLGDRKRERIDALAARAGALPEGDGGVSLVKSAYRRLRRDPVAIIGAVIVVVFLLVALFAPWLAPQGPVRAVAALRGPAGLDPRRPGGLSRSASTSSAATCCPG